jgi:hypothetical protein
MPFSQDVRSSFETGRGRGESLITRPTLRFWLGGPEGEGGELEEARLREVVAGRMVAMSLLATAVYIELLVLFIICWT